MFTVLSGCHHRGWGVHRVIKTAVTIQTSPLNFQTVWILFLTSQDGEASRHFVASVSDLVLFRNDHHPSPALARNNPAPAPWWFPPPPPHSNPFRTKMWSHRTLALAGRRLGRGGACSSVAGWWWCSSSSSSSSLVSSSLRQGTSRTRTTVLPELLQRTHLGTIPFRGFSAAAASSTSVESDVLERDVLPYDVVVVGGGPAGLATAIRFKQLCTQHNRDLSVCVLDKGRCV